MILDSLIIVIGRFAYRLVCGDNSEIRVSGNFKINEAVPIGRETAERNTLIITKIYGGRDGIDGNFLADFYLGTSNDTSGYYSEAFYKGQSLTISELGKFDVYAYGDNAKEIAEALSEFVH